MNKFPILLFVFLLFAFSSFAQNSNERMLFIIDSIPLFNNPEDWNPITKEDIADIIVIKNKDSIKFLGWEEVDAITYIFTKAYRNRPDSIRKIPSLKQMESKNGIWALNNEPYSGKYIDYYNSGKIQDEGALLNGILNGEVIVYYKNGNKKIVSHYKEGIRHGTWSDYYPNGKLSNTRNFTEGKTAGYQKNYFINGQVMAEVRRKNKTPYDTSVSYYSSGRIKQMRLIRNGILVPNKKTDDINYYNYHFYQSLNARDLKEANKHFYKLWLLDSTSADTHFKEGLLMLKEFRFEDATEAFSKALRIEPLLREALAHRALARIKKYKYYGVNVFSKGFRESYLSMNDMIAIPEKERANICKDIETAVDVDFSDVYVQKIVPLPILNYCQNSE
jgi:tetratricopeptide (TPR) repeat protein